MSTKVIETRIDENIFKEMNFLCIVTEQILIL